MNTMMPERAGRRRMAARVMTVIALAAGGVVGAQVGDGPAARALSRCENELDFILARDVGGRSPDTVLDYRRANARQPSTNAWELSGTGRFIRDANDRARTFTYTCSVDMRSGRVNANYKWAGTAFDDEYDRPNAAYPPAYSDARGGNVPQGRLWFSGGIISRTSGKGLDVQNRSRSDEAAVQQWEYTGGANQVWDIIDLGRGEYAIISQLSNKALDVDTASADNGARVIQYRWHAGDTQRWRFERRGEGFFQIVNVASGRCLDVENSSRENGASVQQWDCNAGANNQGWKLAK